MIRLEMDGEKYPIDAGAVVLGSESDCTIRLADAGVRAHHAVVKTMGDGSVAVQLLDGAAEVQVNGVQVGQEPTPVLHGDRITVAGHDILVVEAANIGSTQHINLADLATALGEVPPGSAAAEVVPGSPLKAGRLVSLTDGREYAVGPGGVFLGRDAASDIVVTSGEASRRHAQILPTSQGYVINDSSTNGTWVNDDRVEGSRVLSRSDVIRIGEDEFRFYADPVAPVVVGADVVPDTEAPTPQEPASLAEPVPDLPPPPAAPVGSLPTPPPGAGSRLNNTVMGMPAFDRGIQSPPPAPAAKAEPVLASLLVRKGSLKGERFAIRIPVVNIGRADYNDIVLPDESVSQAHAKLQRRENVWVLTDLGSTNGTQVDGERITEETPLSPGATLQFGELPVLFDPVDESADVEYQPGTMVLEAFRAAPGPPARTRGHRAEEPVTPRKIQPTIVATPGKTGAGRWLVAIVILVAAAAAAYFFLQPR